MEIKVRPVQVDDVFAVAKMLGKITKGARLEIAAMIVEKGGKDKTSATEFALVLFQSLFIDAEDDLKSWLAELIGVKKSVFAKMPASTVIEVIEQLASQEGIRGFFAKASLLAKS